MFICLFLSMFEFTNIPVFWPILVVYFIVLTCLTLKRQIKHMIKHKYLPFQNHPSYVLYFQIHNIKIFWRIKVLISSLIKMYILLCIFIIDLSVCYQTKDMVNLSENVDDHVYPLCQDSSMHSTIDSSLYR